MILSAIVFQRLPTTFLSISKQLEQSHNLELTTTNCTLQLNIATVAHEIQPNCMYIHIEAVAKTVSATFQRFSN